MANVTATTGRTNSPAPVESGNTSSSADEILVTAQTQIQSGDLFDGGAETDTLRLGASINFTSVLNGATSGIRNIEILGSMAPRRLRSAPISSAQVFWPPT